MLSFIVAPHEGEMRLDRWFKHHYPHFSHNLLEKALRKKWLTVNEAKSSANYRVQSGDKVDLQDGLVAMLNAPQDPLPPSTPRTHTPSKARIHALKDCILFMDEHLLVLNKPAGLAVQGGTNIRESVDSMLDYLTFDAAERPRLVHRLDKDTSGILVLARSRQAAAELAKGFQRKTFTKHYWALVAGSPSPTKGTIRLPLSKMKDDDGYEKVAKSENKEDPAITHYKVIHSIPAGVSWVELQPVTGKTHQLRVHCALLGAPILGDGKYGGKQAFFPGTPRQLHLHARHLMLPALFGSKTPYQFTAPLSPHMQQSWDLFGFSAFLESL